MNAYLISGLGADSSAFSRIELPGVALHHVQWVPHARDERLRDYARRLITQLDTTQPFVLIGLSFGGIVAQEMHRYITPTKTILISSVVHHRQFPWFYQLGRWIVPLLSDRFFTHTNGIINYLFGAKGKNAKVLDAILKANDPRFVKWSVNQLLLWRKREESLSVVTIHGTADKIIPFHACDYAINEGSHFMVYSRASEISAILQREIQAITV